MRGSGNHDFVAACCALACTLTVFLVGPGAASAQRAEVRTGPERIVVDEFRGPRSAQMRAWLLEGFSDREGYVLVPVRTYRDMARSMFGRTRLDAAQYQGIAQAMDIRAIVQGRVQRRNGRWVVTVKVINGETGEEIGGARWRERRHTSLRSLSSEGWDALLPHFEASWSPARLRPPIDDEQPPANVADGGPNGVDGQGEEDAGDVESAEREPEEPLDYLRSDALRLELLFSTLRRSLRANTLVDAGLRGGASGMLLDETHRFESSGLGHLELGLNLEFYPGLLLDDQDRWGFFGFYLEYRTSVLLSTTMRACSDNPACPTGRISIDSRTSDLNMGIRLRHRFGHYRHSPVIFGDIGYGIFHYYFDPTGLAVAEPRDILPPMRYRHLHIGAGIEVGLVPIYLFFVGRFQYRLGTQVGQDALDIWGLETTKTGGFRVHFELRTEMPYITPGMYAGISFEFFRWSTTFRGQTQRDATLEPDRGLWEPWVTDSSGRVTGGIPDPVADNYFRLGLTVGYAFR